MTPCSGFRRAAFLVAFVMTASSASGQVINTRPFRALFRTTQDPANSRDRVDVAVFVSAGHDESETTFGVGDNIQIPGNATYGHLFVRGSYKHDGRKTDFTATGSTSTRYYAASPVGFSPLWVGGDARLSGEVARHGQYSLTGNASYSPYYVFSLSPGFLAELAADVPDAVTPGFDPDTDLRTTRQETYRYDMVGSYSHRIGRRTRTSAQYAFNYTDSQAPAFDMLAHRARGRITHEPGRHWNVYGGYGIRMSTYRDSPYEPVIVHDIDGGFGYSRALPFSTRTRVAFSMSSSLIADESTRFRINGSAFLSHMISRTWFASAYYRRDNDVLYGFAAPFVTFTDSIGGSVSGRLPKNVYVTASSTYSRGTYSALSVENVANSMWAVATVHVPIWWLLSTYAEGYYSQYDFQRRVGLLPGVPTATERFGIRGGVTFWVPVLR